jgi:hypothetical protein
MINKIVRSVTDALHGVNDGSTILIGGFGAVGQPTGVRGREPVAGKRARSRRRQLKDRVDGRYNLSGETKRSEGQDKDYGSYASRDVNTERSRTSIHVGRAAVMGT